MEDKPEVELTEEQIEQLEQFREAVQLKTLFRKCEEFELDLENLQSEKEQHMQTLNVLTKRLENIKEEFEKAYTDEMEAKEKLETIKESTESENNSFVNVCLLLGFLISKWHLLGLYDMDTMVLYENGLDVTHEEIEELYNHIAAYPDHPEVGKIRKFVKNSQSLEGVLRSLQALFDTKPMEVA